MTDLYICFSNIDRQYVFSVVNRLEAEGFSCCVPVRDFSFEDDWMQSVIDAVYTSTMVLYFNSEAALKSPRLRDELSEIRESGLMRLDFDVNTIDPETVLSTVREHFQEARTIKGDSFRPVPYDGELPYIFVSYAHKNMDKVLPIIHLLQRNGYRVWYDEGIDPGTEWADNIAEHLENAALLFACLSQAYMESTNCRDELLYARSIGMDILMMYLEKVQMEKGIAMRCSDCTAFYKDQLRDDHELLQAVNSVREVRKCREGIN